MRPLSNKIVVPLLYGAITLLIYWFAELFSTIFGWPFSYDSFGLFELLLNIGFNTLVIIGLLDAYRIRKRWEAGYSIQ